MTHRSSNTLRTPPFLFTLALSLLVAGCGGQARTVVITTKPPDATIRVGGVDRGRGRVVQQFRFSSPGQYHSVVASRDGFKEEEVYVSLDNPPDGRLLIDLKPLTRRVTITVAPVPAYVSIDGKRVTPDPVSRWSQDLEFTVGPGGQWTAHTVTAERKGYQKATQQITWKVDRYDVPPTYELKLEPLRKELRITTDPAGAQVFLDGQTLGASPVVLNYAFPVDPDTGEFLPHNLRVTKAGYDDVEEQISWDEGKTEYVIDLRAKSKSVRIVTDPPGAAVTVDGKELARDATGASTAQLRFPPVDAAGNLRKYKAVVSKPAAGEHVWEAKDLEIGWDGGRKDYSAALREVKTRSVPLVRWRPERVGNEWRLTSEVVRTVARKETTEGPAGAAGAVGAKPPFRVMRSPDGWTVDSLAVSPDGTHVAYALVAPPATAGGTLRAKVELVGTDAAPGAPLAATDPRATELTPSFSPDGTQVVFSSNRGGAKFKAWSVPVAGGGADGAVRLTDGESGDLWPSLDADPKPRVFYQALVDTRSEPRLGSARIGGDVRMDLGEPGGSQPRVSPKGDSLIFARPDPQTGKRDVFQMPADGGQPLNLTHTPDVDEHDAVWSPDGGAIAVASDAGTDDEGRRNYDVWVIDMRNPERPRRVTNNGSWDDSPGWSPLGDALYFRSNRGGSWGIWKVDLK